MKINWAWSMQARNSIHFNPNGIYLTIIWGDATSGSYLMAETPVNSGIYEIITINHTYPITNVCTYTVNAYPVFVAKGGDVHNQLSHVLPELQDKLMFFRHTGWTISCLVVLLILILQLVPHYFILCRNKYFRFYFY